MYLWKIEYLLRRNSFIMKIAFLSDTHGKHRELQNLPKADLLIHAGDLSWNGAEAEICDFIEWFTALDYRYKIFIAGNHDHGLDGAEIDGLPENCYYLCNNGVTIEGLKIWGIPFFLSDEIHLTDLYPQKIARIPADTDILVSHCPPFGILDRTTFGEQLGSEDLRTRVEAVRPRYHLFGHIHETYGVFEMSGTTFLNGSVVNENYELVNCPVVITI